MGPNRARATTPPQRTRAWQPVARSERQPIVWGLLGERAGDNRQVEQLVEALGYPFEIKRLTFHSLQHLPNELLGATRGTLKLRDSAVLAAPWPDLVVAAGRRTVPVARWIRARAGGRTRIVHLGRPRASLASFDLVVTTPQYGLPPDRQVLENVLPFQRPLAPDPDTLERWRAEFALLPRPWIAVLVGGESWPLRFTPEAAARLGERVSDAAAARRGSLLVTTSPRTGANETAALFRALRGPTFRNDWHTDRPGCYPSILALADAFIVTADSISMLAEACRARKPVEIYPLGRRGGPAVWLADRWAVGGPGAGRTSAMFSWLARRGLLTPPRNVRRIADELVARGAAVPFDPFTEPELGNTDLFRSEIEDTVARIRQLVEGARDEGGER